MAFKSAELVFVYSQTFGRRGIKAYSLKRIQLQFSGEDDDFSAALRTYDDVITTYESCFH